MKTTKAMDRELLIKNLEKKGLIVRGTTEEFNGYEGGIWISAEEEANEFYFDYYAMSKSYELGVRVTLDDFLAKRGWYAEWHDPGTIMLWEI